MERTREIGSALVAAIGGIATAAAFLGLYAAVSMPVVEVLRKLVG